MKKAVLIGVVAIVGVFSFGLTTRILAQESRSYEYESIDAVIRIQQNSVLKIEEKQVFKFTGSYHQAFRRIPLNKLDSISYVKVFNQNGQPLTYSPKRLNRLEPSSWGKYTTYKEGGQQYIEWYYDLADTTYTWTLSYDVLGNTEFLKDGARVYWNIFSGYDVPIRGSSVEVYFPQTLDAGQVNYQAYRSSGNTISSVFLGSHIRFTAGNFTPQEAFTVDVVLPAGAVDKAGYFLIFFKNYYGFVLGSLSLIIALVAAFVVWLVREKLPKGRGTIVPHYEPPQNLKPAMAEIILTESLSNKGLTATIIDLAVRGYLKVQEEEPKGVFADFKKNASLNFSKIMLAVRFGVLVFVIVLIASSAFTRSWGGLLILVPVLFVAGIFWLILYSASKQKDYLVTLIKDKDDSGLEDYEKEYLGILMEGGNEFSTRDMRLASNTKKRELYNKLQKLKDTAFKETSADTHAFYVGPYHGKKVALVWSGFIGLLVLGGIIHDKMGLSLSQWEILAVGIGFSSLGLWMYIKYETRLNYQGRVLKEDWLGFKMFLETAERYRLQNLTPDMFQKFLPYAMIFGIEKQWAKAFEQMHVEPPVWYSGAYAASVAHTSFASSGGGFSPSVFSTSFSSAFTSAFASAGASGSSGGGGGGSAGGGGGGGGGGAG